MEIKVCGGQSGFFVQALCSSICTINLLERKAKMNLNRYLVVSAFTTMCCISAHGEPPGNVETHKNSINEPLIERQALILEIVQSQAPIQSKKDFQRHLQSDPQSPIHRLPPDAKEQFVKSIVFTDNGVGGFSYLPLLEISNADAYAIAKLFGVQFELPILLREEFDKHDRSIFNLLACDGESDCFGGTDLRCYRNQCVPFAGSICTPDCGLD